MKRACIVSTVDYKRMTVAKIYIDYFKKKGIPYDIICVDKYNEAQTNPFEADNEYVFRPNVKDEWGKIKKLILGYWKFRKYTAEIVGKQKYDVLIIWNELTTFILSDILRKRYREKYIANIRDFQMFKNPIVQMRLLKAINASGFSTSSSEAYLRYLPSDKLCTMYGISDDVIQHLPKKRLEQKQIIHILYVGQIAWYDNVFKYLEAFGNDDRYELIFAGGGSERVETYARANNIRNVKCYGRFEPQETYQYLEMADVIYNLYGVDNLHLSLAVSIKFYYALYMNLPILVFGNTMMEHVATASGIGYVVNDFVSLADDFYTWYNNYVNESKRNINRDRFISKIHNNRIDIYERLDEILERNG